MTRIFIEGSELDIDKGLSNQITYAIDDLSQLDTKMTNFSKTIVLPGTTNNNNLLGQIFEFNNANFTDDALANVGYNFNASKAAKCRIEVNGLQVVKGIFRLFKVILDNGTIEYECGVFGELGGFIAKLGNLRIEDMDFSGYDHVYAVSGITGSWTNANGGSGLYYPLIDYGTYSTGAYGQAKKDYQYKTFRPALFLREYMDKIIRDAGYTWESNFFNTNFFKRLIIPNNQKELFVPKNQLFYSTGDPTYALAGSLVSPLSQTQFIFTDGITIPSFVGGLFTTSDNKTFTYSGSSGNFRIEGIFNGSYSLSGPLGNISISVRIDLLKNGALAYSNSQTYGMSGRGSGTFIYSEAPVIALVASDTIQWRITTTVNRQSGDLVTYGVAVNGASVTIDTPVPVLSTAELGDLIRINDTLPKNIFQKDFFASVVKMFYLMITEDKSKDRHLKIEPWVDFFNTSASSFVDWSDKVERGKPIELTPMSEVNARYYELKFKQDNDYYNEEYRKKYAEGYGDRVFDNGLDFAKEKETVEVLFSSSVLLGYDGEEKVTPAIFKKSNGVEDKIEHNIRIMQAKRVTGVASWDIMSLGTVLTSKTEYGYAGHLDDPDAPDADLNFGIPRELYFALVSGNLSNNVFNAYYSSYFAEITDKDSKLRTNYLKLTEQDIYNLDFSKFVFIDGGLYRISKLIDYSEGELTKGELLKVIYTSYD